MPAAPTFATPAAPPPFSVRLSASTSRAGGARVDGHVHAFVFFGRVPQSVLYENDRLPGPRIVAHDHRSVGGPAPKTTKAPWS
jgi:hypothetical protein